MLDATPPPERDPGAPDPLARTTSNTTGMPRTGFVLSFLSVIGVAVAALGARWTFTNPNLGFAYGAAAVLGIMIVLVASFALALVGLGRSISWRRAGGRGWLNILSIALAALAILGVMVGCALFAFGVYLLLRVVSEI